MTGVIAADFNLGVRSSPYAGPAARAARGILTCVMDNECRSASGFGDEPNVPNGFPHVLAGVFVSARRYLRERVDNENISPYRCKRIDQLLHVKVFNAVHVEKQPLNTETAIADWVAKQGVDKAKFLETYKSFGVASKLKRAVQLQNDYKVEGVPSFGIAGRFYTDGSIAGSMERAIKVAESLIAQSRTRT